MEESLQMESPFRQDSPSAAPPRRVHRRSQHACDACQARKVKCVYDGTACRACQRLQIPCTQNRPTKRRGPPNQYVQALRSDTLTPPRVPDSPHSVSHWDLDQLGPPSVIEQIIDDWFEFVHSVCPIFHRNIFKKRLAGGEAAHNRSFAALVVSVCANTVAGSKRKWSANPHPITVERCVEIYDQIYPNGDVRNYTLEWCQTRYNFGLALAADHSIDAEKVFRYISEATTGVKYMVYYALPNMPFLSQQLLKRLYWLLFAAICTMELHGRPCIGLVSPQDKLIDLTPLEISDNELDPIDVQEDDWHGNTRSYIPGLNHLSQLFLRWQISQQGDITSLNHLKDQSKLVQRALDYLPPELKWRGGLSKHPDSNFGTDVQMVNLYLTQLHIRSNLLDQMSRLPTLSSDMSAATEIINDRQCLVDDMLEILYHMPEAVLEANGHGILPKIRDIGSALLDGVRLGDLSSAPGSKPSVTLDRLLAKLESLDQYLYNTTPRSDPHGIITP